MVHDRIDELRERHGDIRLIRNEKAVTLYDFDEGRAFEPDFLLFLQRDWGGAARVLQLFVEPKGGHIAAGDEWKEKFLREIGARAELPEAFAGGHVIEGLPFFNEQDWPAGVAFREALAPAYHPGPARD